MQGLSGYLVGIIIGCLWGGTGLSLHAQPRQAVPLTLDSAVEMAMQSSYRVQQLELGIMQTRSWLRAERAALKSKVYMNLSIPQIQALSDNKWNSTLRQYEIVRENTRRWEMNLAVRQPVILFGYPTNGYLSLNNTIYRYAQLNEGLDVRYYNRYFVKFEQPLFQPNHLKHNIERAELNLEREELEFQEDLVDMFDDIADDYYHLVELAYKQRIYAELVANLERGEQLAAQITERDSSRSIELSQVQVELANARERLNQSRSNFRIAASQMKQRLRLDEADSLVINPTLKIRPIQIDVDAAIAYGRSLRPQLRTLSIQQRHDEIDVKNARGWDAFRANLEVTYGREMQDPHLQDIWNRPTNSYSVGLYAYIPIWDWGRRKARIQAEEIGLRRTELRIEEAEEDIERNISNAVRNLKEYQQRALSMQHNLTMAKAIVKATTRRYRDGQGTILDVLQSFTRQETTAQNFLSAFLGYRNALMSLQQLTFYDFERDMPLLHRFETDHLAQY